MGIDFTTAVGRFIHHCGALEFLTNNAIKALSNDNILASDAIRSSFFKRIELLRELLHDRSELNKDDIDSLCNELKSVRKQRNIVAHNPIVSKEPNQTDQESILIVRHKPEGASVQKEMHRDDLKKLINQTNRLIRIFVKLIPTAKET